MRTPFAETTDPVRAEKSIFSWRRDGCTDERYTLSLLGVLTGLTSWTGWVVVVVQPDNPEGSAAEWRFGIRKKWWSA